MEKLPYLERIYETKRYKGHSLLHWAVKWFKMSNDDFYRLYGFNFNPHKYKGLYEIARMKVYEDKE